MAPPRNSAGPSRPQTNAPTSGLFFGGTTHVQVEDPEDDDDDYEDYDEPEQAYAFDSDADEDDEYAEAAAAARRRQAKNKSSKKGGKTKAPAKKLFESDYDSDDKFIIERKKAGVKDDAVVRQLVEAGRQKISAKTVSTRWLRLKKIVERKEEEKLDDELSDWHIGEDDKLRACFNAAEAKYEIELLKLKERKWKEISASLAESLRMKKYTAKACKERWESLEDGTALLPIELDQDKDARKIFREARVAENKRRREEQKAAVIWALGEKDRKTAAKRAIMEEKEKQRQAERARKQAERDEDGRIRAEYRAGLEKKRAEQREIEDKIKQQHREKRQERKNADAMYTYYTGKKLNGRRDANLIKGPDDSDDETDDSDSDIDMEDSMFDDEADEEHEMPDLTDAEESSAAGSDDEDDEAEHRSRETSATHSKSKSKRPIRNKKAKVTLQTLINPRSIMNDAELSLLLAHRNLPRRGRGETHPEVVARLAAADAEETLPKLRELLGAYFERRKGNRETLIRRLQEFDSAASDAGLQGVTAIDPEFKRGYVGYQGKFSYALEE